MRFKVYTSLFALILLTLCFIYWDRIIRGSPFIQLTSKVLQPVSYLSYDDLQKLSTGKVLDKDLSSRLYKQLNTPYVVNSISGKVKNAKLEKSFIRVAQWNIARGGRVDVIKNVVLKPDNFHQKYKNKAKSNKQSNLRKEIDNLKSADIICLNEVDIGVPRTKYANIAKEISRTLGYNYAFATEFLELGPIVHKQKLATNKYLGLHGNAIISRFPIVSTKIIRLPECYDWFGEELKSRTPLEHVRIVGAKTVFEERILTEVRRGGRCALIAEIKLPTNELVTVVSVHLEDRCFPNCRLKQMKYLLSSLRNVKDPVIISGDLNTSTTDTAPTSFRKEITKRLRDPHYVARQIAFAAIPGVNVGIGLGSVVVSKLFQYRDPTYPSIPVIFPNPERSLFLYLEDFRFNDGEKFDFGGDPKRSFNKNGYLSNSNERIFKGFQETFEFTEPRFIAYFKLDWFFIKPYRGRFRPFNGQTLKILNEAYPGKISDHNPITVDISL